MLLRDTPMPTAPTTIMRPRSRRILAAISAGSTESVAASSTEDQIKEMTREVRGEVELVHQRTEYEPPRQAKRSAAGNSCSPVATEIASPVLVYPSVIDVSGFACCFSYSTFGPSYG